MSYNIDSKNIRNNILKFLLISIIILSMDILWLNIYLGKYFGDMVKEIQGEEMNLKYLQAAISYLFICISHYYFIISNITDKDNKKLYLDSFLLGLFIYGIFEFTSGAIFKNWKILPLFVDTIWGGILYLLSYIIYKPIHKEFFSNN